MVSIKTHKTEIGLLLSTVGLLGWLGIKPKSFIDTIMAIPDWVIRGIIILLFILAIYIVVKIRALLNPDILNLPEKFKNYKEGDKKFKEEIKTEIAQVRNTANSAYNRPKKYEKPDRDDEIRFILNLVGNQKEEKMSEEKIREEYFKKFSSSKQIDFNSLWNTYLLQNELLEQDRGPTGYGGTEYYYIRSKGYSYLEYRKIDDEENKKEVLE